MVILIGLVVLMFISAALVIAAGIMSSRVNRHDEWIETYDMDGAESAGTLPQSIE